ncbi:unnamed protein product [Echinostoma caproni]|uniref:Hydroxylysine kinase n=1 Tax=Echinostoma caproni TaxID=27848 RepID=A0A183ANN0_9TREM|nr:unnamed protein product [Echinostoma caproni]
MLSLNEARIPVQIPLISTGGERIVCIQLPTSEKGTGLRTHFVRLLRYLTGETWDSAIPLTDNQYFALGQQTASLQHALRKIVTQLDSPIEEHDWVLINAPKQLDRINIFANRHQHELVQDVLMRFKTEYAPRLSGSVNKWSSSVEDEEFPITLIHGDLNNFNILLQSKEENESQKAVSYGFLDWEDAAISRRSYDLAILLMYMLCAENPQERDVIRLGSVIMAGFQDQATRDGWPLTVSELNALTTFTAARFAQSLTNAEYTYRVQCPGNDYVLLTEKQGGWSKLQDLWITRKMEYQTAWSRSDLNI